VCRHNVWLEEISECLSVLSRRATPFEGTCTSLHRHWIRAPIDAAMWQSVHNFRDPLERITKLLVETSRERTTRGETHRREIQM
jgi:hypothetical protein